MRLLKDSSPDRASLTISQYYCSIIFLIILTNYNNLSITTSRKSHKPKKTKNLLSTFSGNFWANKNFVISKNLAIKLEINEIAVHLFISELNPLNIIFQTEQIDWIFEHLTRRQ